MEDNRNGLQATKHPILIHFARGWQQRVCMRYRAVRNRLDLINHLLLRWSDSRSSQGETESWISETPRTAGSATVTPCKTYQIFPLDFHGCLWLRIKIWCRDGQAYVQRLCFIHNWLPIILSITNKPHISLWTPLTKEVKDLKSRTWASDIIRQYQRNPHPRAAFIFSETQPLTTEAYG